MPQASADFELFASKFSPTINSLEKERRFLKRSFLIMLAWCALALVVGGLLFVIHPFGLLMMILGVAASIVFYIFRVGNRPSQFKSKFKKELIANMIREIDADLKYNPNSGIGKNSFRESGLFREKIHRYGCEDQVTGFIGATHLTFSEVHAEHRTKQKNNDTWHTIFRGVLFQADFNKHFKGETYVLPDYAEKAFGSWLGQSLQEMNHSYGELVKLDNPEFEKEFVVYGSDQIEARYILSTAFLERIKNLKLRSGKTTYLSFRNNRLYLAIPIMENLFEASIWKPITSWKYDSLGRYFFYMELFIGLVDELKLNTRIWSKA